MGLVASFNNPAQAQRVIERLRERTQLALGPDFEALFEPAADPDAALHNMDRWLESVASPDMHLQSLLAAPALAEPLITLLGAGQAMADALVQNPELAWIVQDPAELSRKPTLTHIHESGETLLAAASSYSHGLDRLRYLKQRWNLTIALNDLQGQWAPEDVWQAISDLAEGLIVLTLDWVWKHYSAERGLDPKTPFLAAAFGKLSGHELNYSSDVDLVLVQPSDWGEEMDRHAARFAEQFGRALSDRMGRGSLYRIDYRLRPFGGAGALVPTLKGVKAYYEAHAAPWEIQALLRSRPIAGSEELQRDWEAMRLHHVFREARSEGFLDELLNNRLRVEEHAPADDLKRGSGGIRDIEFLSQILQLLHGREHIQMQRAATVPSLRALRDAGVLAPEEALKLEEAYRFYRQLEHRLQLVDDRQTHQLPQAERALTQIARLCGLPSAAALHDQVGYHRMMVREVCRRRLHGETASQRSRDEVVALVGPLAPTVIGWFDAQADPEAYYRALLENESSLERVRLLLSEGPALASDFRDSPSLTDSLLSAEIEEPSDPAEFDRMPASASPMVVAKHLRAAKASILFRWLLDPFSDVGAQLTALHDSLLRHLAHRLCVEFEILALGSFGVSELGLGSDLDLLLLVPSAGQQPEAERQAEDLLEFLSGLKRFGARIDVDLRLRPEGGKGLLVRSYEGFAAYDLEDMEMWERFALGNARSVLASAEARKLVLKAAYGLPLTPERLRELVEMKRRIERERVPEQHLQRHIKLGHGGLSDIEWLVRLHELRFPTATRAGMFTRIPDRIRELARAGLMNSLESEALLKAHRFMISVRNRLDILDYRHDTVPENPDKLAHLALCFDLHDPNDFLAEFEDHRSAARTLYEETLERLRA